MYENQMVIGEQRYTLPEDTDESEIQARAADIILNFNDDEYYEVLMGVLENYMPKALLESVLILAQPAGGLEYPHKQQIAAHINAAVIVKILRRLDIPEMTKAVNEAAYKQAESELT